MSEIIISVADYPIVVLIVPASVTVADVDDTMRRIDFVARGPVG